MSFRNWWIWMKSKPWSLKWFIIILLIRPVIDNFYYLKDISPFLSPLYIVGLLTPVLCIYGILRNKKTRSVIDRVFGCWSFFVLFACIFLFLYEPNKLSVLQFFLKLTLPVYLFYFLRVFIKTKSDIIGVIFTFIISSVVAMSILLYEIIFNPISVQISRGVERFQGGYADVMNYAIYVSFGFLGFAFLFLKERFFRTGKTGLIWIFITLGVVVTALLKINHLMTIIVVGVTLVLLLLFSFRTRKSLVFVVFIASFIVITSFGEKIFIESVDPLIEKDIEIMEGEGREEQLFHGRYGRWESLWNTFTREPVIVQCLGYPLSMKYPYGLIGGNVHNDFLRILFFTGYIGFIFYLLFLYMLYRKIRVLSPPFAFLALGSLMVLLLYSFSTLPTLYPPLMYPLLSVFAFLSLPRPYLYESTRKR